MDFLVGKSLGIEVKASTRVSEREEKGLLALGEDLPDLRKVIVCRESRARITDNGVEVLPIEHFLRKLWNHEIINPGAI